MRDHPNIFEVRIYTLAALSKTDATNLISANLRHTKIINSAVDEPKTLKPLLDWRSYYEDHYHHCYRFGTCPQDQP
jgi:hypothetical protein